MEYWITRCIFPPDSEKSSGNKTIHCLQTNLAPLWRCSSDLRIKVNSSLCCKLTYLVIAQGAWEGKIFFWTRFENLTKTLPKINDRVVLIPEADKFRPWEGLCIFLCTAGGTSCFCPFPLCLTSEESPPLQIWLLVWQTSVEDLETGIRPIYGFVPL